MKERKRIAARSRRIHRILERLEWPLAILALLVVPALILEDRTTSPGVRAACNVVNWIVWLAFAGEFCTGLVIADRRGAFLRKSWFELAIILVSPPFVVPDALQGARGLRALRILRLMRLVRGLAVAAIGLRSARKALESHGFHYVLVVAIAATGLGAAGIYIVEKDYTVRSAGDAIWWAVVTVTAVGYGDVTPVSGEGRAIALGLMFVGIGVISVFTATIASAFVGEGQQNEAYDVHKRLIMLEKQMNDVVQELKRINR
jgi:voltage-gated potassium channel